MSDYRVFDSLQDVVLVVNEDVGVVYGNQAASTLFEVSVRRLSSQKSLSQFVTLASDMLQPQELRRITESTQVAEIEFTLPTGKSGWVQLSIQHEPAFFTPADAVAGTDDVKKSPSATSPSNDIGNEIASEIAREIAREIASEIGNEIGNKAGNDKNGALKASRWVIYMRDVSLEKTLHDKYRGELDQKEAVINDLRAARAKLEDYSRNLEKMVETRTAELRGTNTLLKTILDSLGQGILVFTEDGKCLPVFSQVCRTFFGMEPAHQDIDQLLGLQGEDQTAFVQWRQAVFSEMLEFEDLVPLAPNLLKNQKDLQRGLDRSVQLAYNPMRDDAGKIQGVVMVATDRTLEVQALREAAHERAVVRRVVRVGRNRESFLHFVRDARGLLVQFKTWHWQAQSAVVQREEVLRRLHTLKGGASSFAFAELAHAAHELEEGFKDLPADRWGSVEKVLHLEAQRMHEVLDTDLASLTELLGPLEESKVETVEIPVRIFRRWSGEFAKAQSVVEMRELVSALLKECLEKPLEPMIRCFESGLVELAEEVGKEFKSLQIEGGDLRVSEEPLRPFFATLIHAFRNSIDHGFETPEQRAELGKPRDGKITVRFSIQQDNDTDKGSIQAVAHRLRGGKWLKIEIADDGRGIDVGRVRAKLIKQGFEREAAQPDAEIWQMVLRAELSTADTITEISGRGVGMNAILAEVQQLHGQIRVFSEPGQGMRLVILVPLSAHPATLTLAA